MERVLELLRRPSLCAFERFDRPNWSLERVAGLVGRAARGTRARVRRGGAPARVLVFKMKNGPKIK